MAGTLSNYSVNTNINGTNGFGRQPAKKLIGIYNTNLTETTDTTVTVPNTPGVGRAIYSAPQAGSNATVDKTQVLAIFRYQAASTVFVADGASAAPDTSGTITAGNSVINPDAFLVNGGDVLHFYAIGASAFVSIEFYSMN